MRSQRRRGKTTARSNNQKKYADKAALENSLKDFQGNLKNLKNSLVQTKADLSVGIDEMSRIKEWQLGRSSGEREEQIRSQSIYIQKLESKIQNIEEEISSHSSKIAELKVTLKTFE